MHGILSGFELVAQPISLVTLVVGLTVGFIVGLLPGFQSSNATAIALPFSLALPVEQALVLMISIYSGATFAGSVPAILLNVPGEAAAAATAIDGYPLAQQGKAAMAIGIARLASALGGLVAITIVLLIIGPLSILALSFGAREMVLVVAFGLLIIGGLVADAPIKGMLSGVLGMLIAAMSASPVTGQTRFTLGFIELYEGVPLIPALIGLFAFSQMFQLAAQDTMFAGDGPAPSMTQGGRGISGFLRAIRDDVGQGFGETLRYPRTLVRSSLLGLVVGIMPGGGSSVGNFLGWAAARRASKNPELFGKGAPEGVVGAEAADNAVACGTLVPMLTLGIPGSATGAVMLGALVLHGIPPGPRVMVNNQPEAYAVLIGALFASLLILPIGVLLAAPMTAITRVPPRILVPLVLVLACAGTFATRNQMFDVWLAIIFGLLGFFMLRHGYPVIPMVLGLVLGPLAELYLMRSLTLGQDQLSYFFQSPIAIILWLLLLAIIVATILRSRRRRVSASQRSG